MPLPTIGIEIEANWSVYFPREYTDWFYDGRRKYADFNRLEKDRFDAVCTELDRDMLPRLERVSRELGLTRGKDAYWEFVFPPFEDISEIVLRIEQLANGGFLPLGKAYPLHITISDTVPDIESAILATCLEILSGVTGARLRNGTHVADPSYVAGWARRGNRGMRERPVEELLLGATVATEFRTPVLPGTLVEIQKLLEFAQTYAGLIRDMRLGLESDAGLLRSWEGITMFIQSTLAPYGLSLNTDWKNPNSEVGIWERYGMFLDSEGRYLGARILGEMLYHTD